MAEIATYKCSNNLCALTVRLSRDFPVWRGDTPRELRTPVLTAESKKYLIRTRCESLCHVCRTVIEYTEGGACSACGAAEVHEEQLGRMCPRCSLGTFLMPRMSVY